MKLCAACSQMLKKDKFSKKQWQAKQQRRCKECIADGREVATVEGSNDAEPPSVSCADGEGVSDEDLFKENPPRDECPICMLPLPLNNAETRYQSCCGKILCMGCIQAVKTAGDNRCLCPFCRTPPAISDGELIERIKERVAARDAGAVYLLGSYCRDGRYGLPQNMAKAMKLLFRAGELGDARSYNRIGYSYYNGNGVERDEKKAKYYFELAAMGGYVVARHNLGIWEQRAGNMDRAVKHFMITAAAGHDKSLTAIRESFFNGSATKDDFETALRAHKESKDEMRSEQREAAAAAAAVRSQN